LVGAASNMQILGLLDQADSGTLYLKICHSSRTAKKRATMFDSELDVPPRGRKGGLARAQALNQKRRKQIARKGGLALAHQLGKKRWKDLSRKGGFARAQALSKKRRSEIAQIAAAAKVKARGAPRRGASGLSTRGEVVSDDAPASF
jgi:hypothetical protein